MQKEGNARRETQLDADCRFPDAKLKQKVEPSNFLPFCEQSSRLSVLASIGMVSVAAITVPAGRATLGVQCLIAALGALWSAESILAGASLGQNLRAV